jgi:Zn-dependent protease/CBS domain-containing protein
MIGNQIYKECKVAQVQRRGQYSLFTIFGFEVKLDLSWLLLGLLITWTLAAGLFPVSFPGLATQTYWAMGIIGAIGVLFSIVFHELSHSLVARQFGMPIRGITLFIFGGVAEMHEEATSPKAEFLMAVAGPIASLVLGGISFGLYSVGETFSWPTAIEGLLFYMGYFNVIVAIFNLVPAFPLDGGRMLRATLWGWQHNLQRATRIASYIGSGFAFILMAFGIWWLVNGALIAGMWWILIGWFLHNAAKASYRQLLMRSAVEGQPVRKFMNDNPVTLQESLDLQTVVDDYVYKYHHKFFPVTDDQGTLRGCISLEDIKQVDKAQWPQRRVEQIMQHCSRNNTVSPDTDTFAVINRLLQPGASRVMVVENGKLVGLLALRDLHEYLSLHLDLERD